MKELYDKLEYFVENSGSNKSIIATIRGEKAIAPFTTENKLMAYLLSIGAMTFQDYENLSHEFAKRYQEQNRYLDLFEMAPRTFGQTWGEKHIHKLFPQLLKATKSALATEYPNFNGEFDLWYSGIRIEVKACRANNILTKGSLSSRAYSYEEAQKHNFKYHFQQLKPSCCDIFIWIGVCKDKLLYWILTSKELQQTGKLCPQHRNENTGRKKDDVFEGQVFMTEQELETFFTEENDIFNVILAKSKNIP